MWNRTGTATVTNGSAIVTGVATQFLENTESLGRGSSWEFVLEGETTRHEIKRIVSDTSLELMEPIDRASASGLSFVIIPTQGLNLVVRQRLDDVYQIFSGVLDNFSLTAFTLWQQQPGNETGTVSDFLDALSQGAIAAAQTAQAASEAARDKAQQWADEDEDTEVEPGAYSARHHAAKAADNATATAADRVATGDDATATAADRVATGDDAAATAADRVATGDDATATAADRVQTGLDLAAALTAAATASANAIAAGAAIFVSTAAGIAGTSDNDIFMVPANGGFVVYENDASSAVEIGRTAQSQFPAIAQMASAPGLINGQTVIVSSGYNGQPETFVIDTGSALTADGALVVALTGVSGRAISTRTWFRTTAEFLADVRVHDAGTILTVANDLSYEIAASAATDHDGTRADGAKFYDLTARGVRAAALAAARPDGSVSILGGLPYRTDSGAAQSATDDLGVAGLVPHGDVTSDHFGGGFAGLQRAINFAGVVLDGADVHVTPGVYQTVRTVGVNDRWGLLVAHSGVKLRCAEGVRFERSEGVPTTYADAYPLLFVGVPDSDVAPATEGFEIKGGSFQGSGTRHGTAGSYLHDGRTAIEFKNTRGSRVRKTVFDDIDSSAIFFQRPVTYDYVNAEYYNLTKNYDAEVTGCTFNAQAHAVPYRALLHAIIAAGVDGLKTDNNTFHWCDDCLAGEGTYVSADQDEDDTFLPTVPGWTLGPVKRCGRDWDFTNNTCINSSEHAVYPAGCGGVISGNTIKTDDTSICKGDIKLRGEGYVVAGNRIRCHGSAVVVSAPSRQVTVANNIVKSDGLAPAVSIDAVGLSSYIDARDWMTAYQEMHSINVTGNAIALPDTAGASLSHVAVRVYTDAADANFPQGQLRGVNISGNPIRGARHLFYLVGNMARMVQVADNIVDGKPFVRASFGSGTVMDSHSLIVVNSANTLALHHVTFKDNFAEGYENLVVTHNGGGSNVRLPRGFTGNRTDYVKTAFGTGIFVTEMSTRFTDNHGEFFLDRTSPYSANSIGNAFGDGVNGASANRSNFQWAAPDLLFFKDDAAGYDTLSNA